MNSCRFRSAAPAACRSDRRAARALVNVVGADRAIDSTAQRDSCVLVDDVENPQRGAFARAAAHEVVRPDVVRRCRRRFQTAFSAVPWARLPEAIVRLGGTRWPSRRQNRSIRFRFTRRQPSLVSSAQMRR
jgi:hypothetical protein